MITDNKLLVAEQVIGWGLVVWAVSQYLGV